MTDFRSYSELYHHGVKGMHWGIRRYQNPDGTLTMAGRLHYAKEKVLDAVGDTLGKDNKFLNKATNTSGKLRKAYFDMSRSGVKYKDNKYRLSKDPEFKKKQKTLIAKSKRYADSFMKEHGKEPMTYVQNQNALKGAAVGALAASLLPIVGVWMTVPAGYYIGSKVKHSDEFSDILMHYGVKGMKWHKHLKLRGDDDDDDDDKHLLDYFNSDEFQKKQDILQDYFDRGDYQQLATWYKHDKEAKAMIDAVAQPQIEAILNDFKPGAGDAYKNFRKGLKKYRKSKDKSRGTYDEVNGLGPTRYIGRYEDWHPEAKKPERNHGSTSKKLERTKDEKYKLKNKFRR